MSRTDLSRTGLSRIGLSRTGLASFAGLAVAPFLWAVSTELGPILPYAQCRTGFPVLAAIAFAAALVSVAFGGWSWLAAGEREAEAEAPRHSGIFLARLGGLSGVLFALTLFYQALASFLLTGCER
jgi:hypothetical protein